MVGSRATVYVKRYPLDVCTANIVESGCRRRATLDPYVFIDDGDLAIAATTAVG